MTSLSPIYAACRPGLTAIVVGNSSDGARQIALKILRLGRLGGFLPRCSRGSGRADFPHTGNPFQRVTPAHLSLTSRRRTPHGTGGLDTPSPPHGVARTTRPPAHACPARQGIPQTGNGRCHPLPPT